MASGRRSTRGGTARRIGFRSALVVWTAIAGLPSADKAAAEVAALVMPLPQVPETAAPKIAPEKIAPEKIAPEKIAPATAAETAGSREARAEWLQILCPADTQAYRALFALQADARWAEADAVAAKLQDRLLMGHVLAQRYLHRGYKASYAELTGWLTQHADEGEARAVWSLANRRRPKGEPAPIAPGSAPIAWRGVRDDPSDFRPPGHGSGGRGDTVADRIKAEIRLEAKRDPVHAEVLLDRAVALHVLDDVDYDEARADVAEGELFAEHFDAALRLSAAARTEAYRPLAHWIGGLADWGLGRLDDSRTHFETLARLPNLSPWNAAAGAFWAARVHFAAHRDDLGAYWLGEAAAAPRTFYGMLARSSLGLRPERGGAVASATKDDIARVAGIAAGKRALALLQIGERAQAETELRILIADAPPAVLAAMVPLVDHANLPAVSLELGARIAEGSLRDQALYPVPRWRPWGGFSVDPALLLAFMRQESEFRPDNRSPAGAIGLMQLMWDTARQMAPETGVELTSPESLRDPEINIALGQAYLRHLIGQQPIGGNLVLLATAYNLGPSWLSRWTLSSAVRDDPLLFLETLPSRETRVFVERVLVNYWVYQLRSGRPAHGLELLAAGGWPVYVDAIGSGSDHYARAR